MRKSVVQLRRYRAAKMDSNWRGGKVDPIALGDITEELINASDFAKGIEMAIIGQGKLLGNELSELITLINAHHQELDQIVRKLDHYSALVQADVESLPRATEA